MPPTPEQLKEAIVFMKEWLKENNDKKSIQSFLKELIKCVSPETETYHNEILGSLNISSSVIYTILKTPLFQVQVLQHVTNHIQGKDFDGNSFQDFLIGLLRAFTEETFDNLISIFNKERYTVILLSISNALGNFINSAIFTELLWEQCLLKPASITNNKPVYPPDVQRKWDSLIKKAVSLPDVISNKLQLKTKSIFLPDNYFPILGRCICEIMKKTQLAIQHSTDCSIVFISQLFGKICAIGKSGIIYNELLPSLNKWIYESPLLCRICSKLFLHINDMQLEKALEPLLLKLCSSVLLSQLFGDAILTRAKLKFLFTHKFLFVRYYQEDNVPFNIISYLSSKVNTESIYKETLLKLLDVWGDHNSIKHSSYDQHMYISKCFLIALSFLKQHQKDSWRHELIKRLMEGVQVHLQSPDTKLHEIAMLVAECLTSIVDKNGKQLKFDLPDTDEIKYLRDLSSNPEQVVSERFHSTHDQPEIIKTMGQEKQEDEVTENHDEEKENSSENEDLDSDDDLPPINPDDEDEDDGSVNGVKPPVYLRDCIAGLLSSNDPNRQEACLNVVEKLVKKQPADLHDVSVELVKILLHLQDQYNITNFYRVRMNAMVTITVRSPKQISTYLCNEFYEENYSINQRIDILDVIERAVTQLSKPETDDPHKYRTHLPLRNISTLSITDTKPEWQKIIDERVKEKTRYFSKGTSRPLRKATENEFTTVAGSFFFPLVSKLGKKIQTCDLFGNDSLVLGKLIYTLGVVIQASDGLQIVNLMAKTLLDLIWSVRFHKEAFVRQSLIYALTMIVLHVPGFLLLTDLQSELFEARSWLQDIVNNDANRECCKMAASCIVLMEQVFKKEIVGDT